MSLKSYVKESKNSIQISFEMDEYGFFQDRGVKGTKSGKSLDGYKYTNKMPPPKAFDKWAIKKGIAPRDIKGKFKSRKGLNFALARSIFEKGIKPTMFFTKPFEKITKKSNSFINRCFLKAFDIIKRIEITGLINGPISKKNFGGSHVGFFFFSIILISSEVSLDALIAICSPNSVPTPIPDPL